MDQVSTVHSTRLVAVRILDILSMRAVAYLHALAHLHRPKVSLTDVNPKALDENGKRESDGTRAG